jgi:hypothetical protein
MNRVLLWLAISIGLAAPAFAQAPAYPKDVQAVLDFAKKSCLDDGGERAEFSDKDIEKVDLTGDGREDYIVHLQNAECPGNPGAFCGTGGCDMSVLIAQKDGSYVSIFDQRVRGYEIKPGRGASTIRFQLHGSYCGGHGNPSCFKSRRITGKKFEFKQPQ